MSTQSVVPNADEDAVRLLDAKAVLAHYRHIRSQPGRPDERCGFCRAGVGAVLKIIENPKPKPDVVPDNRVDEEKDSTSASDSWGVGREE